MDLIFGATVFSPSLVDENEWHVIKDGLLKPIFVKHFNLPVSVFYLSDVYDRTL